MAKEAFEMKNTFFTASLLAATALIASASFAAGVTNVAPNANGLTVAIEQPHNDNPTFLAFSDGTNRRTLEVSQVASGNIEIPNVANYVTTGRNSVALVQWTTGADGKTVEEIVGSVQQFDVSFNSGGNRGRRAGDGSYTVDLRSVEQLGRDNAPLTRVRN
jgi:hypothetical protein